MNKGEWMETHALMPPPSIVGMLPGVYSVTMPEDGEIMSVGLEEHGWIVVIARIKEDMKAVIRKVLVLGNSEPVEYQYTRYIGSVNVMRGESSAWRHVFEVTRPDDDEEPMRDNGKVLLHATPGC